MFVLKKECVGNGIKRAVVCFLIISFTVSFFTVLGGKTVRAVSENFSTKTDTDTDTADERGYYDYYNEYSAVSANTQSVTIGTDNITAVQQSEKAMSVYDGVSAVILSEDNEWCEWDFAITESGIYSIRLNYYPLEDTGLDIELGFLIDGKLPFREIDSVTLPRTWIDESVTQTKEDGNDIRPAQIEKYCWNKCWIEDNNGMYAEPYRIYLEAGTHKLRISVKREAAAVSEILFGSKAEPIDYNEYIKEYSDKKASGGTVTLQAEKAYEKSSPMLYPLSDRSNAATYPNHPFYTRYNTIGGSDWSGFGSRISWIADVPEDGLYQIQFRVRQNFNPGLNSYRNLYINGEIPFSEARNIPFEYHTSWYVKTLGDEKPMLVYLKKGDVITLEVTSGDLYAALRDINQIVQDLNALYRKIIIITGTEPDMNRDYGLENSFPGLSEELENLKKGLYGAYDTITDVTGKKDSQASCLVQMCDMLDDFIRDSELIPKRISKFKGNIETISSVLILLNSQPLEIDCFGFVPESAEGIKESVSVLEDCFFEMKKFIYSFVNEYNSISSSGEGKSITVWVGTGRDQAQVLDNLISDTFTPVYNTQIQLSMVETKDVLLQATLAGKGPDVALMVEQSQPVNLAMRGALMDLSEYVDSEELQKIFHESALKPFYYQGGLYGLPETESFNMLFYRTDIFEELGLEPPQTWEEFYHAMEVIQKANLQVGINEVVSSNAGVSASISVFDAFLFQNGGTYYDDDLKKACFDTAEAYDAFDQWVALYRDYKLSKSIEFYNRFRSGEMPMGITSMTIYNQLMAAAPEIRGLWSMSTIPGKPGEEGAINRAESSAVSGCMVLNSAVKKGLGKEAAEFLMWWVSDDTQLQYGRELEATMGIGARYYPANLQAFRQMGWSKSEAAVIEEQWNQIINVNQIPGNYIVTRNLTNALRACYDVDKGGYQTRRQLTLYNKVINDEITRKRKEFNLD